MSEQAPMPRQLLATLNFETGLPAAREAVEAIKDPDTRDMFKAILNLIEDLDLKVR